MTNYFRNNLGKSLQISPLRAPLKAWAVLPLFMAAAAALGFGSGILTLRPLDAKITPLLPLTLFIFPSLLEEAFFRGVLIPRDIIESGAARAARAVIFSTILFVAWHPFNALVFNHSARPLFLDPWFLLIVSALGLTCGYSYVVSRSIWLPVIIHWTTVTLWVLFLGGRNLVLEL
ncbi:MAG: CPBP family glutamic-type intramembrane protease [Gammaproteobacteria bacterium]|jgi:uncharacterized protein